MRVQQHESSSRCLFIKRGYAKLFTTRLRIDWPFAEYGHMVQETPCWMANDAEGQEKQRDYMI